ACASTSLNTMSPSNGRTIKGGNNLPVARYTPIQVRLKADAPNERAPFVRHGQTTAPMRARRGVRADDLVRDVIW
ncbi:MAG: hypothetical protein WBC88_08615, partial [Candidatus Zixiibacteriota bacterium]